MLAVALPSLPLMSGLCIASLTAYFRSGLVIAMPATHQFSELQLYLNLHHPPLL